MSTQLTPEQIQDMRDMRLNQKKTPKEIIAVFKEKRVEVKGWQVSYHCRPAKGARPNKAVHDKKKKGKKEEKAAPQDEIKSLVDDLFAELEAYSAFTIRKIRLELLKRRGEVRQMRIDAGEPVQPLPEPEEKEE